MTRLKKKLSKFNKSINWCYVSRKSTRINIGFGYSGQNLNMDMEAKNMTVGPQNLGVRVQAFQMQNPSSSLSEYQGSQTIPSMSQKMPKHC